MHFPANSRDSNGLNPQKPYRASLHSIGKPPVKPWKMPIAPLPPVLPKVYKVDPMNFKKLVQNLTGSTQIITTDHHPGHRLRTVAPPPLDLVSWSQLLEPEDLRIIPESNYLNDLTRADHGETESWLMGSSNPVVPGNYMDDLQLNLSPESLSWCSFLLASPGTLSGFEQSAVLATSAQCHPC